MDYNYLVFLYVATIILPALVLLCFYVHIYTVIIRQVRQTVTFNSAEKSFKTNTCSYSISKPNSGAMLRVLGAARKREVKATQNLSIIVIFFMMCWLPLYTINCIKAFCAECFIDGRITFAAIILSHLNSAVNPLLYAYNLKDFRAAMKTLILKMIGKDVMPVQSNQNYRFSIASQHRIQTLVERQQTGSRIYIGKSNRIFVFIHKFNLHLSFLFNCQDSPVWKRQQQQQLRKCHSVIGSSPVTQKVPTKSQRAHSMQMWNITEVPSAASDNPLTATANSSTNSNSNSSCESAADIVKRQYSFNYDHLDDDISSFKQIIDKTSSDHVTQGNATTSTNQKVSLNISLDNLSSISVDSDFKLKQISFLINVRLESSSSRKKNDSTITADSGTPKEKHKEVIMSVSDSNQSFNRNISKSDTNVNRNVSVLQEDDTFAPATNVCRKRKTGAENFSCVGSNTVGSDRCLKRVKSDSNCIEFHM